MEKPDPGDFWVEVTPSLMHSLCLSLGGLSLPASELPPRSSFELLLETHGWLAPGPSWTFARWWGSSMPDTLGEAVMAWYKTMLDELRKIDCFSDKGWTPNSGAVIILVWRGKSDAYRRLDIEFAIKRQDWDRLHSLMPMMPFDPTRLAELTLEQITPFLLTLMYLHEHCYAEHYHPEYQITS